MSEEPAARLAQARSFLALQGFKQIADLTYEGKYYKAVILTDRPTREPPGMGCKPSYVVRYSLQ